jgi:hypothetical protein
MGVADLNPIQTIVDRLADSPPSHWGYTAAAYAGDEIEGVPSFNIANDMNVPDLTALFTNPNVLNWGNQTQGASLARALVNHMFGRMSFNLRKLTDKFYEFLAIEKRQWAENAFMYDAAQEYEQDDVCTTLVTGGDGIRYINYYIRTSASPLTITGIAPTVTAHWTLLQMQSAINPQKAIVSPGYGRAYTIIDLSNTGTYAANTWFPVVSDALGLNAPSALYDRNTVLTEVEAYVTGTVSGQASACRASLSATVKTGRWNVASGFDSAAYPTSALINNQTFINDVTGADIGIANSPIGFTMLPKGQQVVFWLRGGSKYGVWSSFGAGWSIKTASYANPAGDPAVAPQVTRQFAYNPSKTWGRFAVPTPVLAEDATNKAYVDLEASAASILAKLLTVDGAGSGLDADTLDGLQGSRYLISNAVGVASASLDALTANGLYYTNSSATGRPTGASTGAVLVGNLASDRTSQLFFDFSGNVWVRFMVGGVWGAWSKQWSENNDGPGSGLDADLFDGIDSTFFVYGNSARASTGIFDANAPLKSGFYHISSPYTNGPFGANAAAWIIHTQMGTSDLYAFQIAVRNGQYGIRYKENGTWSLWNKLWTQDTDGPGSGLDADTVDGANLSTDGTMASDSDAKVPSEKAVRAYVGDNFLRSGPVSSTGLGTIGAGTIAIPSMTLGEVVVYGATLSSTGSYSFTLPAGDLFAVNLSRAGNVSSGIYAGGQSHVSPSGSSGAATLTIKRLA